MSEVQITSFCEMCEANAQLIEIGRAAVVFMSTEVFGEEMDAISKMRDMIDAMETNDE